MKDLNYNLKLPIFDSKIKFYFSLLFTSINDFEVLTLNFGDNIDVFNHEFIFPLINDISRLNIVFENLKWNNSNINLKDKTILKMFNPEEVIDYFNLYSVLNQNFNIDDPEDLEKFYIYMLFEKVKEKKQIEYGNLYDLFDNFSDEEILNAVANLDYDSKKTFINYFGIKGDLNFELNSNDRIKNEILIKLYSYMLLKRDDSDIPSIIRNVIGREDLEYTFFDYIRNMCNDNTLSNEFISEMLSKMDYNSIKCIKEVFGEKLDKKRKPSLEKNFKKAVENLSVVIKVNKEYRKRKNNTDAKRKKAVAEEKQKEAKKENKEQPKKEEPKQKKEEKKFQDGKEKQEKEKKKKEKTKEPPKKEDKKQRLKKFLKEEGLEEKDFKKAVFLLDQLSIRVVSLYYGIKEEPIELDEISELLGIPLEDIVVILEKAEKKIKDLIKTGEINKTKEENKKEDKKTSRLIEFIKEKNIKTSEFVKATVILTPIEKTVVDLFVENKKSVEEISSIIKDTKENVTDILNVSTDKIISVLSTNQEKDNKSEEKKEIKEEIKKEEKTEVSKYSLNEFLKDSGLSKTQFLKGFNTLDAFSKNVLSMYLGLYSAPLSVNEIANRYHRSESFIERVISSSKSKIVKANSKEAKINLNDYLKKNNISKDDFVKAIDKLPANKRNLIKAYFGISMMPYSMEELERKYGKDSKSINIMINNILKEINVSKDKKQEEKQISKLDKFLTVNGLIKEQFLVTLDLLEPFDKKLVSMYFGLNGREMSIAEIAIVLKMKPEVVKSNLENILKHANTLAKSKDLNGLVLNNQYQNLRFKIINSYHLLMADENFIMLANSNPSMANILSVVTNSNLDIDKASKALMISKEEIIRNLTSISVLCDSYITNNIKKINSGFSDGEKEKQDEIGRRY